MESLAIVHGQSWIFLSRSQEMNDYTLGQICVSEVIPITKECLLSEKGVIMDGISIEYTDNVTGVASGTVFV